MDPSSTEGAFTLYTSFYDCDRIPFGCISPSKNYTFMIILSPVGSYYKEGIHPVKILVENEYVRAVAGGTGTAKTAGHYASGLKAQEVAGQKGLCTGPLVGQCFQESILRKLAV